MRQCEQCGLIKYPNDPSLELKLCSGCRVVSCASPPLAQSF